MAWHGYTKTTLSTRTLLEDRGYTKCHSVVPLGITQTTERATKQAGFLTPPSQNDSRTFIPKHAKPEGLSIMVSRNFVKEIKRAKTEASILVGQFL